MKRVKMRTSAAGPGVSLRANEVALVDDTLAAALVEGGYAELVADEEPASIETPIIETASVEPAAETATAQPQRKTRRRRKTVTKDSE